ncbi:MAG TPA: response regulator, partial [Anaeromyxobacteraceae bacterium]|nr:response regulator [Anaeromyxobacteraceae bacterium]
DVVRTVLVVEDDADLNRSLDDLLSRHGFRVVAAHDPVEAWEALQAGPRPAAILVDLLTPRMQGADFVARLRRDARLSIIPLIAMSGDDEASRTPPRVERFLRKPFTATQLLDALRQLGVVLPGMDLDSTSHAGA